MEIVGIGTEIVECVRIGRMIEEHGELFLTKVFTSREVRECRKHRNPTAHFAARWAGKEAILKSLGIRGVKKLAWTELEIRRGPKGALSVHLSGALKSRAEAQHVADILVALAHCRSYATAYALALKA